MYGNDISVCHVSILNQVNFMRRSSSAKALEGTLKPCKLTYRHKKQNNLCTILDEYSF